MLKSISRFISTAAVAVAAVLPLPATWLQQEVEPPAPQTTEKPKLERPEHAFIWKVEKEGHATSYLFGTMHVPDPRFTKFNDTVRAAFKGADGVYTELPMDVLESPEAATKISELGMLKDGKTLRDFLSEEDYERLGKITMDQYGVPLAALNGMRPFMVSLSIEQFSMLKHFGAGKALDSKIYTAAEKAGKEVGGVEVLDEQLAALGVLTDEEAATSLAKSIDRMEKDIAEGRIRLLEMADIYLSGDESKMLEFVMEDFDPNDPIEAKFMHALLDVRNKVMAERSGKRILQNPDKSYVFAFGALHFIGENNVADMMRDHGFKVTRLTAPAVKEKAKAKAEAVR